MAADSQYAYAVARIRVYEKKMLDKSKLDRMIDAKTPEDAFKVLVEAEYGSRTAEAGQFHQYERLMKEESDKLIGLMKEISPQPELFDMFLQKYDYHNLKVLLKSEFSGSLDDSMLVNSGTIAPEKLKALLKERKLATLPEKMRTAIVEVLDVYNRTSDPQMIDIILDRAAYSQMMETARSFGNSFVTGLVEAMIDLSNINTFIRLKRLNKPWDFIQKVLLPGGRIDMNIYAKSLTESLESFMEALERTPYHKVCREGISSFLNTGSLTKFEKLSDDYIMSYVKKKRYAVLGLEPLLGYFIAKQTEIRNAGIIMVGKINNIPGETIRERLRETYA